MAIAFVQSGSQSAVSGSTVVVTLGTAPIRGNALIAFVGGHSSFGQPTVTGGGVTWTQLTSSSSNATTAIWVGQSATGANTAITCTFGGAVTTARLIVAEFSGIVDAVVTALDAINQAGAGTASPAATTAITPAFNNELIVAVASVNSSGLAITAMGAAGNSYSDLGNVIDGDATAAAYLIQATKASTSTSWTITGSPLAWNAHAVSLKGRQDILDDLMASYPPGQPAGGRDWPTPDAAKEFDEMTAWTNRVILPSAGGIAQQMEDGQAHDVLGGRNWPIPPPARQLDGHEIGFNPSGFIPPFDPTVVPLFEQLDIPSPQYTMEWEDDSPLNIFLPPPGWDDGFDFSFQPVMKLEEYREEGAVPIIPSAFDDDFLFSFQPQMKIDDERDYQMVIIIPRIVHDDDWTQNWQQSPMKIDDERDYQVRIFLPNQVLDDDWQMAVSPQMKLEEVDNGLLIILPPFDPTRVPQAEQMDSPDMRALLRDDWTDSPLQLFLPPFDPTQRPVVEDGDRVINAQARWVDMEDGRALEIFLPPSPWTADEDNTQRPQPPANLSVEPEGEWFNLVVVLPLPPDTGPIPGRSAFLLVRGVHIKR